MATKAEEWDIPPKPTQTEWPVNAAPEFQARIADTLAKAQAVMMNPGLDATNPHFKNKFASLAAVRNAVIPVLAKHGISVVQDIRTADGTVSCTTVLLCGNERLSFGPLTLPVSKNDAQGFGSAITYARRYSLMAVACVVGDDDDDANAATGKPTNGAYAEPHRPQGDIPKSVPTQAAQDAANRMHAALHEGDIDERVRSLRVMDLHEFLNKEQELYIAAAELLTPKDRTAFKTFVSLAKAAEKADKAASGKRF